MHPNLSPVELAQAQLRAALLVYLHELRWENDGQRHSLSINAVMRPDGGLEIDVQGHNLVSHDLWGMSL